VTVDALAAAVTVVYEDAEQGLIVRSAQIVREIMDSYQKQHESFPNKI